MTSLRNEQCSLITSSVDPDNDDDDENDDVIIQATWRSDGITVQQLTEKFSKVCFVIVINYLLVSYVI